MRAIFLDIETTGLDPTIHRAIEIAFKVVDMGTGQELLTYHAIIKQPLEVWERRDPFSMEINGFTWEKTQQGKIESEVREDIIQLFTNMGIQRSEFFYLCQNPAFDRNFFAQLVSVYTQEQKKWPYHWLDFASMYWALQVKFFQNTHQNFPIELNLSKNTIAEQYGLPIESTPHSALNGVNHLILCYATVIGFA